MEFKSNDLKLFINTLWYDNVNDYDFFKVEFFSLIGYLLGLSVFLII